MNDKNVFPTKVFPEGMTEDQSLKMEGRRVLFDKKVSLLPVEIRKAGRANLSKKHGRSGDS